MTTPDATAAARIDALDRQHGTASLYRRLDDRALKGRRHAALLAYTAAVTSGDQVHAQAARDRFLRPFQGLKDGAK